MRSHRCCCCRSIPNPICTQPLPRAAWVDGQLLLTAWFTVLHCPTECFKGGPSEASKVHCAEDELRSNHQHWCCSYYSKQQKTVSQASFPISQTEMGEEEMERNNNEVRVSNGKAEEREEESKVIGSDPLSRELHVEMKTGITQDDLVAHFSSYGVIESVHCPSHLEGQAAVIFSTAGSVEHCLSVEHSLNPQCSNDTPPRGPILLRLVSSVCVSDLSEPSRLPSVPK